MGAAGTSVVLQGPAIQVNCPDGYADVGEECNCALATNTMGFFIENAGHGGCCAFAQPQPPGQTADIWFEHTPDADGYFTYYPYVYLNGQVVLQVTSQWYAPDYGILSLDLVTSAHQGDFTASSRTNVVNESGSDVHKAYWLNDDMWLLGPAVLPVQAGVPVLIDITANARAEAYKVGNYALMDLCQLGGIRVAFILAVWSPPVPII